MPILLIYFCFSGKMFEHLQKFFHAFIDIVIWVFFLSLLCLLKIWRFYARRWCLYDLTGIHIAMDSFSWTWIWDVDELLYYPLHCTVHTWEFELYFRNPKMIMSHTSVFPSYTYNISSCGVSWLFAIPNLLLSRI